MHSPSGLQDKCERLPRPVLCAFTPISQQLQPGTDTHITGLLTHANPHSILIKDQEVDVPWISSLPFCRQALHWLEAEKSAQQLLGQLQKLSTATGASIPEQRKVRKQDDLIETSVACTAYQHPNATANRAALIAQAMLLLWVQDDATEYTHGGFGSTVSDYTVLPDNDMNGKASPSNGSSFVRFVEDIYQEDPVLGRKVVKGMMIFLQYKGPERAPDASQFRTLQEYIEFRTPDIARIYNFAAIEFARNIDLTDTDKPQLQRLEDLANRHTILVQDLYSFDRERLAKEVDAEFQIINAVPVVEALLSLNDYAEAKIAVRDLIVQTEMQAKQEYERLQVGSKMNAVQESYVEGLFQFMAGHLYFSATAPRYGFMVPGAMADSECR